jgi:hypothetical protein
MDSPAGQAAENAGPTTAPITGPNAGPTTAPIAGPTTAPIAGPTTAPNAGPNAGLPVIRASDAEREATVTRLSEAAGEGRLTLEELGVRVSTAYTATTRAELEHVLVDLPAPLPATEQTLPAERSTKPKRRWIVSVMGEHHRRGRWRMSPRTTVVTVMGETDLDLRGAILEGQHAQISTYLMMGEMKVRVPRGVEVEVTGFVLMGSRKVKVEDAPLRPGTPTVHIRCIGMMGEVSIQSE